MAVFADTFFYVALLREGDRAHERAWSEAKVNRQVITTEFVLLELGDACSKAKDHADFLSLVAGIRASSRVKVVSLDSGLMRRGLELMRNRPDKDWSLSDCISFVVMEEMGLREALTGDRHFEQAGFKALLA